MRWVVSYDIIDDRRRYTVDKILCGYGVRVQKSVFECHLGAVDLALLEGELRGAISAKEDDVRIYSICRKDHRGIRVDGPGQVTEDWSYKII